MAKLLNGVFGGFSGKVGNVVGYMYRGVYVIRSVPSPRPWKPSQSQKTTSKMLTTVSSILSLYKPAIRRGFISYSIKTHWNLATSTNYPLLVKDGDSYTIAPEKLILSNGHGVFDVDLQRVGDTLNISWTPPDPSDDHFGSDLIVALSSSVKDKVTIHTIPTSAGRASISLSPLTSSTSFNPLRSLLSFFRSATDTPTNVPIHVHHFIAYFGHSSATSYACV